MCDRLWIVRMTLDSTPGVLERLKCVYPLLNVIKKPHFADLGILGRESCSSSEHRVFDHIWASGCWVIQLRKSGYSTSWPNHSYHWLGVGYVGLSMILLLTSVSWASTIHIELLSRNSWLSPFSLTVKHAFQVRTGCPRKSDCSLINCTSRKIPKTITVFKTPYCIVYRV